MPQFDVSKDPKFKNALANLTPELLAMPESEVKRRTRLDPTAAYYVAWAAAGRLEAYRDALVALCGPHAGPLVDALPTVAFAARQADVAALRLERSDDLTALYEPVHAAHRTLLTDCESLVNRGLLAAHELANARSTQGYQATLNSVEVLVDLVRAEWPRIQGRTQITEEDLSRAEKAAMALAYELSQRASGGPAPLAAELRVRALSKLVATYEEVRRMTLYLRHYEEDADTITPSLYAGRGTRKVAGDDEDVIPPPPVTPTPVNGGDPFST